MTDTNKFSPPDFAILLLAALMLVAFLFMPWMHLHINGTSISTTGARFLLDQPVVDFERDLFVDLFSETIGAQTLVSNIEQVVADPNLVLIAGILALLFGLWALADSTTRELAAIVTAGAGILGLIYFMTFFANNRHNAVDVIGFMGMGFWLALLASIGLILQVFIPRNHATPTQRVRFAVQTIQQNRMLILVLILLILLPHMIGWYTNSSPFPIQRGRTNPTFIASGLSADWMLTFIQVFVLAIFVMSYNLMFGFTGVISFGHAMFFGIGAYTMGLLWEYTDIGSNEGLLVGLLVTLVICGVTGFLIGLVSLRLRGVYFAIFTLAIAEAVFIFIESWQLTKGDDGFSISQGGIPDWLDPTRSRLNLYYVALFVFVFSFLFIRRLVNSPTGAVFKAIRENEERAKAIGFNTLTYKLLAISVSSMLAGIAGMLYAIETKKLGPEQFGVGYTVNALLMTIIGGVGTFTGPVIGSGSLHIANTVFRDDETAIGSFVIGENWELITGVIFIVVVLVFPYGIVGTWHQFKAWLMRRAPDEPDPQPTPQEIIRHNIE
ncbi:MAG: hypothetical protein CUN56_11150 [Phototrophicales bacterium]|nr:MAG: hypothetical protein CUN56_11150 [Phototrophicales bacterium]RMG70648.1 MAG: branched-chain amino acid ABC transporter permease [Chloroflexota bacterium]